MGPHATRKRGDFGVFGPIGLNGIFLNRNIFNSCIESCQYFCMDNISLKTSVSLAFQRYSQFQN